MATTLSVLAGISFPSFAFGRRRRRKLRIGILTDIHYANREPNLESNRYYRQSLQKVRECVEVMNREKVDFLIEIGDLKDQGDPPDESETLSYLAAIESELQDFDGPVFHVLGNHDMDSLSKIQFLDHITNHGQYDSLNYYSFSDHGYHFVVLDANYSPDGSDYDRGDFDWTKAFVPHQQLEWLKTDLALTGKPVIVFIHHQLDSAKVPDDRHCPVNAAEVRQILEDSGKVRAVFQGHYHAGSFSQINGIFYYTLKAVVDGNGPENNNYAIVELNDEEPIKIRGFRQTKDQIFK
ncbi:metallophosphoesterase [Prolixibacter denitrificans]|uniref:Calcineurin-like phosphoesterase family protein n=1 Tax=Prolixibacter denitrificans TaxID=1541063 RepID=A0A2P8CHF7_9BACT|nr:metallophosphoesterase [Prolixibacter denitrificans]PSK84342.1 calcineurin-like phosphoesterase family protein [Prolixibacter denitrificans]